VNFVFNIFAVRATLKSQFVGAEVCEIQTQTVILIKSRRSQSVNCNC